MRSQPPISEVPAPRRRGPMSRASTPYASLKASTAFAFLAAHAKSRQRSGSKTEQVASPAMWVVESVGGFVKLTIRELAPFELDGDRVGCCCGHRLDDFGHIARLIECPRCRVEFARALHVRLVESACP